jgi:hypothetical protein
MPANLVLIFSRDGKETERRTVGNGQVAVSAAMQMLVLKHELRPGDSLTVLSNDNGGEAATSSGPSPGDASASPSANTASGHARQGDAASSQPDDFPPSLGLGGTI